MCLSLLGTWPGPSWQADGTSTLLQVNLTPSFSFSLSRALSFLLSLSRSKLFLQSWQAEGTSTLLQVDIFMSLSRCLALSSP